MLSRLEATASSKAPWATSKTTTNKAPTFLSATIKAVQVSTAATGILQITGKADITEYIFNAVKCTSTSTVGAIRKVVWNYGVNQIYIPNNNHLYQTFPMPWNPKYGWTQATKACSSIMMFGMTGNLATVTEDYENK